MLELARGISHWAHGFKNSVIFLFNTGEEEGLNGAHSFITQVSFLCCQKLTRRVPRPSGATQCNLVASFK